MIKKTLVSNQFEVPVMVETSVFRLRMLSINDLVKDYDAVMSSVERLTKVFGDNSGWPKQLTLEQDLIDLGWHQKEFQSRTSFAYTVMSLDEQICLGCVYILPPYRGDFDPSFDAVVFMWVRDSAYNAGLDEVLYSFVKDWLDEKWPFQRVAYPGREID